MIEGGHIPTNRTWTVEEVARRLGVSVRRVRMIPPGELPFIQYAMRGVRRYDPDDVEAFVAARTRRA